MSEFTRTERTKVKRHPERANYDRELVHGILDQAFVCSVGFVVDGQPYVVPTNYVRDGERLLLHGSTASRLMRTLCSGAPFCLSVTLLDGIVFSPTAAGHSVNYRSVVVLGTAEKIESAEDKLEAMRKFVEYVIRGRWETVRAPSEQELDPAGRSTGKIRNSRTREYSELQAAAVAAAPPDRCSRFGVIL